MKFYYIIIIVSRGRVVGHWVTVKVHYGKLIGYVPTGGLSLDFILIKLFYMEETPRPGSVSNTLTVQDNLLIGKVKDFCYEIKDRYAGQSINIKIFTNTKVFYFDNPQNKIIGAVEVYRREGENYIKIK